MEKKKFFCFFLLMGIYLFGCEKSDKETLNACRSTDPLENVIWLKTIKNELTNCYCEMSIIQGKYNNQTVFYVALTDPLCNGISTPTLYDCDGNIIRTFTMNDFQEFYKNVNAEKVLYRCKTGK